jgi:anti-sigma factor RsiW
VSDQHEHTRECLEIAERLSEYLDGELPAAVRALVEAHNEQCANCRKFVESLQRTKELAHLLPRYQLPEAELERLAAEARKRLGD